MAELSDKWDGGFDDNIQCPHCGAVDEEYTDYPSSLEHDGDKAVGSCSSCGADFHVVLCVTYTFASKPLFIGPKRNFAHWCQVRAEQRDAAEALKL